MAANVFMNAIFLDQGGQWHKLAETSTVVNATVMVASAGLVHSDGRINVRFRGGTSYLWPVDTQIQAEGIDLSELEVSRSNTDVRVFVFGYTR